MYQSIYCTIVLNYIIINYYEKTFLVINPGKYNIAMNYRAHENMSKCLFVF